MDWIVPTHVTRTVKEINRVILSPEFVIKVAKKDGVVLCVVKVNITFLISEKNIEIGNSL